MEKKYTPEEIVLLDYYAGIIMRVFKEKTLYSKETIALNSYEYAAAMIEERKKYIQ